MTAELFSSISDAAIKAWAVVAPVLAALLATWLTQRHQLRVEDRRERQAIAAEHRQTNRSQYLEALKLADRVRDKVGTWAILATLYCQGTDGDEEAKATSRWTRMKKLVDETEEGMRSVRNECKGELSILRATANRSVAEKFTELLAVMETDAPAGFHALPLPEKTLIGLRHLPSTGRIEFIADVDRRIEIAADSLNAAIGTVLTSVETEPTSRRHS